MKSFIRNRTSLRRIIFMNKDLKFTDSEETIKPGERVIIEFNFPQNLNFVGRADKVLEKIIKENDGMIKRAD